MLITHTQISWMKETGFFFLISIKHPTLVFTEMKLQETQSVCGGLSGGAYA